MTAPIKHDDHLRHAIRLACDAAGAGGGPFGAVVVRDGVLLAEGANQVTATHDPTAHAEIVAIRAACRATGSHALAGATLYSSCEPCPMCLAAAHWARIGSIHYAASRDDAAAAGFDDALLYRELTQPTADRTVPTQQHLAEAGQAPFALWTRNADRAPY